MRKFLLKSAVNGALLIFVISLAAPLLAATKDERRHLAEALEVPGLDNAERQSGNALMNEADGHINARMAAEETAASLRAASESWPTRMRELQKRLDADPDTALTSWQRRLPANADTQTLERVLAGEQTTLQALRVEEERLAELLTSLFTGPGQSSGEITSLREERARLGDVPDATAAGATLIDRVRAWRNQQQRLTLDAEIVQALLERETLEQRQRGAELELQVVRQDLRAHALRGDILEARIAARDNDELAQLMQRLEDAAEQPGATDANQSLALGRELIEQSDHLADDRAALPLLQSQRDSVENALRAATTRIELGGNSEAVGRWLWSERRRLVAPARLRKQLDDVRGELADLRLREVVIAEQQQFGDARKVAWTDPNLVQGEILDRLKTVLQRRAAVLEMTDGVTAVQLARTEEMQKLLDRHLLWTRSHGVVDGAWLERAAAGFADLLRGGRYEKTFELAWRNFLEHPLRWIGSLVLLGLLVWLRGQAIPRIQAEARATRHIREDSYRATSRALGWTILAALPFPVAFCLLGLLLRQVGQPGNFSDSVGIGLLSMGAPFFFTQLIRFAAIERGLGHAHFRWLRARCESLRRSMQTFNWVVLPLWFVVAMSVVRNVDLAADVSARMALVLACGVLAFGSWKLFAPDQLWVIRGVEVEPSTWRKAIRLLCTVVPLSVGVLAIAGWVHSSGVLLQALLASVSAAVCIALVVGMLGRWMLLGERRLAYKRAIDQAAIEGSEGPVVGAEQSEVTLQQINEQTGRLVRALRLTLIAGAVIWVWADVLPAVGRLDEFALWHVEEGTEGHLMPMTAMDLVAGALILLLTWAAARNLPGLVEIGLLSRTRIDAPTRYAITSILRYAIVIVGMLVGLSMLGMRWGQLQWMAAALTVGLGFGLQEIFANFVSGLILLFERPFRVGDVITVGEYTGVVNRIHTRATTIVDFDNREIVVPNKTFITGQLTNWTLTDTVTRMTTRIGVDYGTEPALVHRLLLQAAMDVPEVMREPEPRTWFLSIGASSLDFELRVFVASVADRLVVQNALHTRINALLLENGIDIAYPHLNVNLRQLPPASSEERRLV